MTDQNMYIFIGLVFVAVFFLAQGLIVPVFGESRRTRKRLLERLSEIELQSSGHGADMTSIMRAKYLRKLNPWEKALESLPMMEAIAINVEQAGSKVLAYRLVALSVCIAIVAGFVTWEYSRLWLVTAAAVVIGCSAPFMKIRYDRARRIEKFEEQLPDCIDIIRRAVLAGHPFSASLKMVADDMDEPAAKEFGLTFAEFSYGNDVRHAMLGLLTRVPSVTVMALVTAILVQKETGGNLAEILKRISHVIRERFRFHRKVKTLSAEGRLSAWVLAMVPLGLFLFLSINTPDYLPIMLEDEFGRKLVGVTAVWGLIGVYFIRRIIRIDV